MVGAALYIIACSAKNRARRRLQRLREPRYLLGALVGVAYLVVAVFGRWRTGRFSSSRSRRSVAPTALLPGFGGAGPALAGAFLLAAAGASLLMPVASGLLEYTPAEMSLLFPAPVSRRQLLVYRLMRAQWAVLLGAAIFAATYPVASLHARLRGLAGGWLLLMTCHVFFTGVTLARVARVHAPMARRTVRAPLLFVLFTLTVVGAALGRAIWQQPVDSASEGMRILSEVCAIGLPHLLLMPFVAVVTPLFADTFASFVWSLPPACLVYVLTVAWVLHADEVLDASPAEALGTADSRQPQQTTAYRARNVGWVLPLDGRPEGAFLWKGALQTLRVVDRRILLRLVLIVVWLTVAVSLFERTRGVAQIAGMLAAIGSGFTVLIVPQILRLDLRQDLQHMELLKTWPVRGAAVVRGEIAWPALVTTAGSWFLALLGLVLSASAFSTAGLAWRVASGSAWMILTPALVFAQYTIHNAVALLFPAWIPMGRGRPRGVDAMGQRLILLGATWLMLILAFAPGAMVGGMLWLAFHRFLGPWILIPGALIAVGIVALELLMATEALGPAYERLDLGSVERPE